MIKKLAKNIFGRKLLYPVVMAACGWSQFTYLLFGIPKDKLPQWADSRGWLAPDMEEHWQSLLNSKDRGQVFHELKNVGVEWCKAHSQPAMKTICMYLIGLVTLCFILGLLSLLLFLGLVPPLTSII